MQFRDANPTMPPLGPLKLALQGKLDLYLIDPESKEIVDERHVKNMIVDPGEIWIAELLAKEFLGGTTLTQGAGEIGNGLQVVQVGISGAAEGQNDFKMKDQSGITTSGVATINDVSGSGNIVVARGTFGVNEGNGSLREAGLFSSTGIPANETDENVRMFNRTTFDVITKTDSFELALQWTITIGSLS